MELKVNHALFAATQNALRLQAREQLLPRAPPVRATLLLPHPLKPIVQTRRVDDLEAPGAHAPNPARLELHDLGHGLQTKAGRRAARTGQLGVPAAARYVVRLLQRHVAVGEQTAALARDHWAHAAVLRVRYVAEEARLVVVEVERAELDL